MARWVGLGLLLASVLFLPLLPPEVALASSWSVAVQNGSSGESVSQGLPAAPTGAGAVCTSTLSNTVSVSWNPVTHASSYSVYEATSAATGPYSLAASGVSGTSWTSPGLASGNYWFEVTAYFGSH